MNKSKQRFGAINGFWKGGKSITKDGYVMLRINGAYVLEHRFVMSRSLKRPLKKYEIVHHINGVPNDNRLENLKLCTKRTHRKEHVLNVWSKLRNECARCGRNDRDHASKGLCTACSMYFRTVRSRGYECEYAGTKRLFSAAHKKNLSKAMRGNANGKKKI